jgi:hypothetical protein
MKFFESLINKKDIQQIVITKILEAIKFISSFIIKFGVKYLKPFWFSKKQPHIIAPYVYVFLGMCWFFVCIGMFLYLSWAAMFLEVKNATIVLPTLAGVIATLVVMMTFMIKVYNEGKEIDNSTNKDLKTPKEPEIPNIPEK